MPFFVFVGQMVAGSQGGHFLSGSVAMLLVSNFTIFLSLPLYSFNLCARSYTQSGNLRHGSRRTLGLEPNEESLPQRRRTRSPSLPMRQGSQPVAAWKRGGPAKRLDRLHHRRLRAPQPPRCGARAARGGAGRVADEAT